RFREFVELNEIQLYGSIELSKSIYSLFPYATLNARMTQPSSVVHTAAAALVRFLDKYFAQPLSEYEGLEATATFRPEHQQVCFVYLDGSVWLAWRDLIARVGRLLLTEDESDASLVATHPSESCISSEVSHLGVSFPEEEKISFRVYRACDSCWPPGLIDPTLLQSMRKRRDPSPPKCSYEKTGHLPSKVIKRVLERTANQAQAIVVRRNTVHYCPDAADPCKLELHSEPNQIKFTISHNAVTFHGYFTTTAENPAEQSVALTYLDKF